MPQTTIHEIRPQRPFAAEFPLSLIDGLMPRINNRYLFIWETARISTQSLSATREDLVFRLIAALQSLLTFPEDGVLALPEILGNVHENRVTGRLTLKVSEESHVPFRVTYRNDITFESLDQLAGFPRCNFPAEVYATGMDALPTATPMKGFCAQITFIDGGFVICVTKHHSLLDGNALAFLIKQWFSRARSLTTGEDIAVLPPATCNAIHEKSALSSTRPVQAVKISDWSVKVGAKPTIFGLDTSLLPLKNLIKWIPFIKLPVVASGTFHFSAEAIRRLKLETEAVGLGRLSTNDVLSALIWRCMTRARLGTGSISEELSCLCMAANARQRIQPSLPKEYFGNAVFTIPTHVGVRDLTASGIDAQARASIAIRKSLTEKSDDNYIRSFLMLAQKQSKLSDLRHDIHVFGGKDIFMTNWEQYFTSTSELDVGCGSFRRMRLPAGDGFDGLVMIMLRMVFARRKALQVIRAALRSLSIYRRTICKRC
ncbi:uncharacterized protein AB675_7345 [Cyphellophora attinorum]|uniref:Trichothecene 3-O-acetyltransferase n=1 Tax=Cyphellophora attinorum TaxID=1664694 RepID=A0A0N1HJ35_9EURO|nr:uncharacterized protein AB675_7345 [Phialophora attinorum]KPI36327.1 hypothetical protein AB675_7345 [Phialophora attinorum]